MKEIERIPLKFHSNEYFSRKFDFILRTTTPPRDVWTWNNKHRQSIPQTSRSL